MELVVQNPVDDSNIPIPRPRNVRYEYDLERTFNSDIECKDFIDNEKCWKVHDIIPQKLGVKPFIGVIKLSIVVDGA